MIAEQAMHRPAEVSPRLPDLYHTEDWAEVNRFLQQSSGAQPLLNAAAPYIRHYFGASAGAALTVVRDPEGGGAPELFVRVETEEDWQAAAARLDRFDEGWWLEARADTDSLVTVDIAVH